MWKRQLISYSYDANPLDDIHNAAPNLGGHTPWTCCFARTEFPRAFMTETQHLFCIGDFSPTCGQIVVVLKQAERDAPVAEAIRKVGIRERTFTGRRRQYVEMETDHARQMKQLQEQNGRLKQLPGDLSSG
jgi:putative transposase